MWLQCYTLFFHLPCGVKLWVYSCVCKSVSQIKPWSPRVDRGGVRRWKEGGGLNACLYNEWNEEVGLTVHHRHLNVRTHTHRRIAKKIKKNYQISLFHNDSFIRSLINVYTLVIWILTCGILMSVKISINIISKSLNFSDSRSLFTQQHVHLYKQN